MFAEAPDSFQHSTRLIPESRGFFELQPRIPEDNNCSRSYPVFLKLRVSSPFSTFDVSHNPRHYENVHNIVLNLTGHMRLGARVAQSV
jgi:hypothetical protein